MIVYGTVNQKVKIDPIDVLEELLDEVRGNHQNWVFQEHDNYYRGWEQSAGSTHSIDMKDEITKEEYDFYMNIKDAIIFLKNKKK
jgi:hypothetical protein